MLQILIFLSNFGQIWKYFDSTRFLEWLMEQVVLTSLIYHNHYGVWRDYNNLQNTWNTVEWLADSTDKLKRIGPYITITNRGVIYKKTIEENIYQAGWLLLLDGQTANCSAEKTRCGSTRSSRILDVICHGRRLLAPLQTSWLLWYEHACCFLQTFRSTMELPCHHHTKNPEEHAE